MKSIQTLRTLKTANLLKHIFELDNEWSSMDDRDLIERYILEAWDKGLTGADVVTYVQYMSSIPSFEIEPVLQNLIARMTE
jgi:hypothetical protein